MDGGISAVCVLPVPRKSNRRFSMYLRCLLYFTLVDFFVCYVLCFHVAWCRLLYDWVDVVFGGIYGVVVESSFKAPQEKLLTSLLEAGCSSSFGVFYLWYNFFFFVLAYIFSGGIIAGSR